MGLSVTQKLQVDPSFLVAVQLFQERDRGVRQGVKPGVRQGETWQRGHSVAHTRSWFTHDLIQMS